MNVVFYLVSVPPYATLSSSPNLQVHMTPEAYQWLPSQRYQHEQAVENQPNLNGFAKHAMKREHVMGWDNAIFHDYAYTRGVEKFDKHFLQPVSTLR